MTYFDDRAREWDSDPDKVLRAKVVAEAMRAVLPLTPSMTALEYGCGTGLVSFALQTDFSSIMLADSSQGMLDVLAAKIKDSGLENMHPIRLDLNTQPLPPTHFDVIYSLLVMHHIPDTDTTLRHFHTLLNPSGYLCISDLEKEDGTFHTSGAGEVHLGFEPLELQAKVEAAGFKDVSYSRVYTVVKVIDGKEKPFPIFLMIARKM